MTSKTSKAVENVLEHADAGLEKTEGAISETLDVIEETLDTLERIPKVNLNGTTKKQQILILGFTSLVSAGVGGFVAYKLAQKRLRAHYEEIAETEIAAAKEFFAGNKEGVFSDPISARDALIPEDERQVIVSTSAADAAAAESAVEEYASGMPTQSEKDRLLAEQSLKVPYHEMYKGDVSLEQADAIIEKDPNADVQAVTDRIVFPKTPAEDDNFDMEKEAPLRTYETPYVITHDEYFEGEREFEQQSATWFAGDSVLVDSADETMGVDMVGVENMSRFGHGSKDENIVYVRNERFEIDFEVALAKGTYTKDILGLDP